MFRATNNAGSSPDSGALRPNGVRFLFAGFLLCAFALSFVREVFNEPYPGPFMPAFKGAGLKMESPTQASIVLPKITVTFSDQTTAEIPETRLFGDIPSPSVERLATLMIVQDPSADPGFEPEAKPGMKEKVRAWAGRLLSERLAEKPPPPGAVSDDVRRYLLRRLEKCYPTKTPVSLTISIYRDTFPLADFHNVTNSGLVRQSIISFHEGS